MITQIEILHGCMKMGTIACRVILFLSILVAGILIVSFYREGPSDVARPAGLFSHAVAPVDTGATANFLY